MTRGSSSANSSSVTAMLSSTTGAGALLAFNMLKFLILSRPRPEPPPFPVVTDFFGLCTIFSGSFQRPDLSTFKETDMSIFFVLTMASGKSFSGGLTTRLLDLTSADSLLTSVINLSGGLLTLFPKVCIVSLAEDISGSDCSGLEDE